MIKYKSPKFLDDARGCGVLVEVNGVVDGLTLGLGTTLVGFEHVGKGIQRKRLSSQYRLFARVHPQPSADNTTVVPVACLLRVLHRKDIPNYGMFVDECVQQYNLLKSHVEPIAELIAQQSHILGPSLDLPPPALIGWCSPAGMENDDIVFYQGRHFTTKLRTLTTDAERHNVRVALDSAYDRLFANPLGIGSAQLGRLAGYGQVLWYVTLDLPAFDDPTNRTHVCILLGFGHDQEGKAREAFEELRQSASLEMEEGDGHRILLDAVAAVVQVAYPLWFVDATHADAWLGVAHRPLNGHATAFLALSAEEWEQLDGLQRLGKYPLFLEGRAGSGKTTVLHYFYKKILTNGIHDFSAFGPPVYLTHSRMLRDQAEQAVRQLAGADSGQVCPERFMTFREFGRNLLPIESRARFENDAPGHRIDFSIFRREYGQRFKAVQQLQNVSSELAWFVIRAFIKGWSPDRFMDVEQFRDLPASVRSDVSDGDFELVHKLVWTNWYKPLTAPSPDPDDCVEQTLRWDDQDLARAAARRGEFLLQNLHPMIVCDESQDFTRTEIHVLLRAMPWGRYDLYRAVQQRQFRLPLVMAGDPMQTINPSGFRWNAVQTALQDELGQTMLTWHELNPYHEVLHYNYRSQRAIAQLANSLQLAQKVLFGFDGLRPQRVWDSLSPRPDAIVFFDASSEHVRTALVIEKLEMVLTPNDEWRDLPELASVDCEGFRERFISLSEVKGSERDRVALFGFGAEAVRQRFAPYLTGANAVPSIGPELMRFGFFFNRLYVAATRARQQIIVIDTQQALDEFWGPLARLVEQSNVGDIEPPWIDTVMPPMVRGTLAHLANVNHVEEARRCFADAMARESSELFRSAARHFEHADLPDDAGKADAWATYYEGHIAEAGRRMLKHGEVDRAREWLWEAACWEDLPKAVSEVAGPTWLRRADLAGYAAMGASEVGESRLDLGALIDLLRQEDNSCDLSSGRGRSRSPWQKLILLALEAMHLAPLNAPDDRNLEDELSQFVSITQGPYGLHRPNFKAAEWSASLAFRRGDFSEAVRLWGMASPADEASRLKYSEARARTADYPQNLAFWGQAKRFDEVIRLFEERKEAKVLSKNRASRFAVARAFRECWVPATGDLRKVLLYAIAWGDEGTMLAPWVAWVERSSGAHYAVSDGLFVKDSLSLIREALELAPLDAASGGGASEQSATLRFEQKVARVMEVAKYLRDGPISEVGFARAGDWLALAVPAVGDDALGSLGVEKLLSGVNQAERRLFTGSLVGRVLSTFNVFNGPARQDDSGFAARRSLLLYAVHLVWSFASGTMGLVRREPAVHSYLDAPWSADLVLSVIEMAVLLPSPGVQKLKSQKPSPRGDRSARIESLRELIGVLLNASPAGTSGKRLDRDMSERSVSRAGADRLPNASETFYGVDVASNRETFRLFIEKFGNRFQRSRLEDHPWASVGRKSQRPVLPTAVNAGTQPPPVLAASLLSESIVSTAAGVEPLVLPATGTELLGDAEVRHYDKANVVSIECQTTSERVKIMIGKGTVSADASLQEHIETPDRCWFYTSHDGGWWVRISAPSVAVDAWTIRLPVGDSEREIVFRTFV